MAIRVFIADDHAMFREGLKAVLRQYEDFEVVGEAEDGPRTLACLDKVEADVLLLDLTMPGGMSGARVAEEALRAHRGLAVVVLTMHEDEYYLRELFEIGAIGFVLKRSSPDILVQAIKAAKKGQHFIDPGIATPVVSAFLGRQGERSRRLDLFTERECEVVKLLALGYTNAEVARKLHISERTVESHRNRVMTRLNLRSRAELVQFAIDNGLIPTK